MQRIDLNGEKWLVRDAFMPPRGGEPSTGPRIDVYCGDNCLNDGSPENFCISLLTNGKAKHPWSGPLVVMKQEEEYGGSGRYVDVDDDVLKAAKKYFTDYDSAGRGQMGVQMFSPEQMEALLRPRS